jgi:anti-anti-sigma regulatory factor
LVVCCARDQVFELFQLTHLDRVIKFLSTREEALAVALVEAMRKT